MTPALRSLAASLSSEAQAVLERTIRREGVACTVAALSWQSGGVCPSKRVALVRRRLVGALCRAGMRRNEVAAALLVHVTTIHRVMQINSANASRSGRSPQAKAIANAKRVTRARVLAALGGAS